MPHDVSGKLLQVGDTVTLRCRVTSLTLNDDYCNAIIESVQSMYPGENKTIVTVNTKQVEKVGE
jgi:hypothetical protein